MKIFLKSVRVRPLEKSLTFSKRNLLVEAFLFLLSLSFILENKLEASSWNFLQQTRVKQLPILVSMESTLLGSEEVVSLAFREMSLLLTAHQKHQGKQLGQGGVNEERKLAVHYFLSALLSDTQL